jgi:hypothetical protein
MIRKSGNRFGEPTLDDVQAIEKIRTQRDFPQCRTQAWTQYQTRWTDVFANQRDHGLVIATHDRKGFTRAMPKHLQHSLINRRAAVHTREGRGYPPFSTSAHMATGRVKRPPIEPMVTDTHALPRFFSDPGIFSNPQNVWEAAWLC